MNKILVEKIEQKKTKKSKEKKKRKREKRKNNRKKGGRGERVLAERVLVTGPLGRSLSLVQQKGKKRKKRVVRPTAVRRTLPSSGACCRRDRGMESLNELV